MDDLEKAAEDRLDNRTLMTLIEAVKRQGRSPESWTPTVEDLPLTYSLIRFSIAARHVWTDEYVEQDKFDRIADYALTYTGE